ncbi:SD01790p [Anopheles sinensis]|uniref:SD01790p n=1 Tax=Anopheles sinensis TaxID=74873 RepID=A0A084WGC2_ANOSI|nr:SD01790p [Anopheles sinensis]
MVLQLSTGHKRGGSPSLNGPGPNPDIRSPEPETVAIKNSLPRFLISPWKVPLQRKWRGDQGTTLWSNDATNACQIFTPFPVREGSRLLDVPIWPRQNPPSKRGAWGGGVSTLGLMRPGASRSLHYASGPPSERQANGAGDVWQMDWIFIEKLKGVRK